MSSSPVRNSRPLIPCNEGAVAREVDESWDPGARQHYDLFTACT